MLKLSVILILAVICLNSIQSSRCSRDDFAEFDEDFEPGVDTHEHVKDSSQDKKSNIQDQNDYDAKESKLSLDPSSTNYDDSSKESATDEEQINPKKPDLKLVNAPLPKIYRWESYYIEIAFLLASFLYLVSFFLGCGKNQNFAHNWYESTRDYLKQNFTLVGGAPSIHDGIKKKDDNTEDESLLAFKKQRGLIKVSESMYTLWCSGRIGVEGLLIEVNLLKRQDMFSMALNLLKVQKDNIVMRFLLPSEGYENFVFCLANKSQATRLARDMVDINTFCPKKKPLAQVGINIDRLFAMSELSDVLSYILDYDTTKFLKTYEREVNYIHISDQYSSVRSEDVPAMQKLANPKRMATFSFNLSGKPGEKLEFIKFALTLLDRLRRLKLARDSKQKSDKNRQKITDILQKTAFNQRQEAAQAKKDEARRLEKERMIHEDDPEKQRRWEKKEAKRELKKNKGRVKHLKIKSS